MDTLPHSTPQRKRRVLVHYDGRLSNRVNSHINGTGRTGAYHQENVDVIYGMVDPRDSLVFYIGLTNNLYHRFKQHLLMNDDKNERKQARIQEILDAHMLPWMQTLEVVDPTFSAREREIAYIKAYREAGYKLLNDEVQKKKGANDVTG